MNISTLGKRTLVFTQDLTDALQRHYDKRPKGSALWLVTVQLEWISYTSMENCPFI